MINIGIVTGEFSGDKIGSILIKNIIKKKFKIKGVIGPELKNIGLNDLFSIEDLSVFGLIEPLIKIKKILKIKKNIEIDFIKDIDIFIGIDFPGLNLNIEKKLKKNGIFTLHIVSPSIWAWRKHRIKNIKKSINLLMIIFPFEKKYYTEKKIPVKYIGHPCLDIIKNKKYKKKKIFKRIIIGLLPGSRNSEIENHINIYKKIIENFKKYKNIFFLISAVSINEYKKIKKEITNKNSKIIKQNFYRILKISNIIFTASGTAVLESSLHKKRTIIIYKINNIIFYILKKIIKIKYIAITNIINKKKIHEEYIQKKFNILNIKKEIIKKQNIILTIKKKYIIEKIEKTLNNNSRKNFTNLFKKITLQKNI